MTTTTISKLAELTTNAVIKGLSNKTLNPGNCLAFCTVHGSRAYGTHMPESDWDIKGILILSPEDYLGCFSNVFEQVEFSDKNSPLEFEGVAYELRKILKLASECNPNVIEVLFTHPQHHLVTSPASELLLDNRELFVNKKARHTFAGYAHSQLKRIKSHRSWLLNPPSTPPSREEFGLSPKHKALSKSAQGAFTAFHELHGSQDTSNNQTASERLVDGFVAMTDLSYDVAEQAVMLLQLEQNYQNRLNDWKQYQQWLTNRNPARAALEAACGFDSKHGMHMIRLLRMCVEILETGKVNVDRSKIDRAELLEVRHGHWTYDQLMEESDRLMALIDTAAKSSKLPESCDKKKIDRLCCELIQMQERAFV